MSSSDAQVEKSVIAPPASKLLDLEASSKAEVTKLEESYNKIDKRIEKLEIKLDSDIAGDLNEKLAKTGEAPKVRITSLHRWLQISSM